MELHFSSILLFPFRDLCPGLRFDFFNRNAFKLQSLVATTTKWKSLTFSPPGESKANRSENANSSHRGCLRVKNLSRAEAGKGGRENIESIGDVVTIYIDITMRITTCPDTRHRSKSESTTQYPFTDQPTDGHTLIDSLRLKMYIESFEIIS